MLTDLGFLVAGASWPPPSEMGRINLYRENEALFLTKHENQWKAFFDDIAQRLKKKNVNVDVVFNYHQLLSKKLADFVCGEPPAITTSDKNTDRLLEVLNNNEFDVKLYEAILDVSKAGNGVFKILGTELSMVDVRYWFPVSDPTNLKKILYHVIAYPITFDKEGKPTELYVEIHSKGSVEIQVLGYEGDSFKGTLKGVKSKQVFSTGLEDFAVVALTNTTYSGSIFGLDDYAIINSILKKIMWRVACGNKVLDKHSDPSLSGPSSALEQDPSTGMWFLNLSNYFKRDSKDDPDVSYITWNGNLDANFKEIEMLFDQLYILSEMGSAFLEGGDSGNASSGTALKLRMTSPRIKARRLVGINAEKVKSLIVLLAKVNGISIEKKDLAVAWKEGLPNDPVEDVNILATATGNKPIMSQLTAIMRHQELSFDDAETELERIRAEEAVSGALVPPVFGN